MLKPEKCLPSTDFRLTKQWQYFVFVVSIFISVSNIKNATCVIPEASHEGPLRPFKSYDDVVMFHYNVPKQVLRATWQFAAFMDNSKCPQRKVNIFLKWGSYPVISVNNATYPSHMYVDLNDTIQITTVTTFEPKSMMIVPVYSPEPGDWFVSAYLSYWDEKIHQKGLGLDCRYSLGSVAVWSATSDIENIPLGYQKNIKTSETISYYKIYIPMDTWNFQVDIWGCNFTTKKNVNFHDPCIKNLELKGRSLPLYNHSVTTTNKNLMSMDTYTFTESFPFQDEWYYLMVVSSSAIKFNVKVTVSYCPIRTVEEVFFRYHLNISIYPKASDRLYLKNLKEQPSQYYSVKRAINQSQIKDNSFSADERFVDVDDNSSPCVPRYQLVRIKHAQIFAGDYLLRVKEWLTSWLTLTDTYPVIVQFDVLPLVDIGGTLDIKVNLEIDKTLIKQQVNVVICINRGRIPKIENGQIICDDKNKVMTVSSDKQNSTNLLIPYPQPDIWYIAFKTTCYVNGLPAHCEMEKILVSLNIKLRACVFDGSKSCGEYGTCEEIRKGFLYFSACKCFGGRQGWGCTDATNAITEFSFVMTALALTLSNFCFIPAIYLALKRKLYTEGLVYSSTMFFSAFYHACDQPSISYCIAKFEVLQYCDFFLGILAFWVTLIAMADLPMRYIPFCHMLGVIIITFGVESNKTGLSSILVPLTIGCFIPVSSYGFHTMKIKKFIRPKKPLNLVIGLTLVTVGILLFSLIETESNYQYVHSAWHVIIALSLIFLLPVKEDLLQDNKTDDKSLGCEESSSNSVFSINGRQQNNHLIEDIS